MYTSKNNIEEYYYIKYYNDNKCLTYQSFCHKFYSSELLDGLSKY